MKKKKNFGVLTDLAEIRREKGWIKFLIGVGTIIVFGLLACVSLLAHFLKNLRKGRFSLRYIP